MKTTLLFVGIIVIVNGCSQPEKEPLSSEGENHFRNIKMLTEEGENAEAYLSFDETKLIYQATVGDLECDQIFTMNIDGTDKRMVSTGESRTTCAYFLPANWIYDGL